MIIIWRFPVEVRWQQRLRNAVTPDADVYSIIQAGIYGAKEGARIGGEIGRDVAGPSVVKRIEMAVDIGLGKGTQEEKMVEIAERIGMGLHVAEAIPSAFGFFAAGSGNPGWMQLSVR